MINFTCTMFCKKDILHKSFKCNDMTRKNYFNSNICNSLDWNKHTALFSNEEKYLIRIYSLNLHSKLTWLYCLSVRHLLVAKTSSTIRLVFHIPKTGLTLSFALYYNMYRYLLLVHVTVIKKFSVKVELVNK